MSPAQLRRLRRIAAAHGVQTSYIDMAGNRQGTSPDVLHSILQCLGASEEKRKKPEVEPVLVAWNGKLPQLRLPQTASTQLTLETGERLEPDRSTQLPFGYHTLTTETGNRHYETLIISAPTRSYSDPSDSRGWGVFVPMYALHSRHNGGAGHFGTWRELVDWLHPFGASVVATLPLLASFLDAPVCEPSPYSPASRFFWNEFYLDIRVHSRSFAVKNSLIDYAAEAAAKHQILQRESDRFFKSRNTARFRQFQSFLRNHPHLEQYSRFRAACDATRTSWHSWPERMRAGKLRPSDYREADKNYHAYAQWLAQQQMDDLLAHCRARGMKFYLDLPLGVHPDSYDVWRERESFALEASAGAPPDPCFTRGQDWGFSPLHPQRLRETKYRYFIDYMRFQMRHTGLLRIDHIMGLHRLYWIPKGRPASEGAYVTYPADELYAILCLESHRNKTILVGENLGTVPLEVNNGMSRHHLRQTYVVQYELPKLRRPPALSVASLNTHDMPPFAAFLRGDDIQDRYKLGLIPKKNLKREQQTRRKLVAALRKFLKSSAAPRALLDSALRWLASSSVEIALINLEDLWLETLPQNVPGTSTQRPNWRRKTRLSLDQLKTNKQITALLRCLTATRLRTANGRK